MNSFKRLGFKARQPLEGPILEISQLNTWFPLGISSSTHTQRWLKALDDVSLELYAGETLGLLGESGSGRTVLARTLMQIIRATSGKVILLGKDLVTLSDEECERAREPMQIVRQDFYDSVDPKSKVSDVMEFSDSLVHTTTRKFKIE